VWSGSVHQAGTLASRPAAAAGNNGFLYFATDDNGGSLYRSDGSSWMKVSAGVNQVPQSITMTGGGTLTNMPAAVTEFDNLTYYRKQFDLTNATQARIVANQAVTGSTSAKLRAQYSTDQSSWSFLDGSSGPSVGINAANTVRTSSWVNLASGAKADVYLRLVTQDGDAVADPSFGFIDIQVK